MAGDIDLKQLHAQLTGQRWEPDMFPESLFRPLSHTHDPITSHAAERSIRDSGALETHNKHMAWLVARHPGLTASEYYAKSQDYPERFKGWDLQEIRRRLTTNMPAHVYQGEARMGLRKKREVTWFPK